GPSYPLYIDAFGALQTNRAVGWPFVGMPRGAPSFAVTYPQALLRFSSLDDKQFPQDDASQPTSNLLGLFTPLQPTQREMRYSYAYLLRRRNWRDPSIVDATVVAYYRRPVQVSTPELSYSQVAFDANSNQVTVAW